MVKSCLDGSICCLRFLVCCESLSLMFCARFSPLIQAAVSWISSVFLLGLLEQLDPPVALWYFHEDRASHIIQIHRVLSSGVQQIVFCIRPFLKPMCSLALTAFWGRATWIIIPILLQGIKHGDPPCFVGLLSHIGISGGILFFTFVSALHLVCVYSTPPFNIELHCANNSRTAIT